VSDISKENTEDVRLLRRMRTRPLRFRSFEKFMAAERRLRGDPTSLRGLSDACARYRSLIGRY